ncbi:MAG: tetratricopeptide repeat protein, partial [Terriglobia bacterium]
GWVVGARAGPAAPDRYLDLRIDDHKQPIVELRRILSMHQGYAALRRANRAWFREKNAPKALREARRAVALMPDTDAAYTTLGTVLYFAGDREAAKQAFRTALRLNPKLRPRIATMAERNPDIAPKFIQEILEQKP